MAYADTKIDIMHRSINFVRKKVKSNFFVEIQAGTNKNINFFVQNTTLEYDYWPNFFGKWRNETFKISNINSYDRQVKKESPESKKLFTGFLRLEDSERALKLRVYTLSDLLSDMGGLGGALYFIIELVNMLIGRHSIL